MHFIICILNLFLQIDEIEEFDDEEEAVDEEEEEEEVMDDEEDATEEDAPPADDVSVIPYIKKTLKYI